MVYLLKIRLQTKSQRKGTVITGEDKVNKYSTDLDELVELLKDIYNDWQASDLDDETLDLSVFTGEILTFKGKDDLAIIYAVRAERNLNELRK